MEHQSRVRRSRTGSAVVVGADGTCSRFGELLVREVRIQATLPHRADRQRPQPCAVGL